MSHDYSDFVEPTSEDSLAELARLADAQLEAQQAVARAEVELKKTQEDLRDIAEIRIPELMEEMGVETFTTTSGVKIAVKEKVRASILAANKMNAFHWLRENGHAALIKRIVKVQFGMGEDEVAAETARKLEELNLPVQDDSSVHPSTLSSFVRQMLAAGSDVPEELISVHRQRVSTIKI